MANFSPFSKTSLNITHTLNEAAKDRQLNKSEVDFDLLSVQTLIQSPKYKEWTIIDEPLEKIFDAKMLKSDALLIRQEYQIRVRPYKNNQTLKNLKIDIAANKAKSKVIATFRKGSIFPCEKSLAKLLKKEINHKKLKLGFLIGHFEEKLNATLIKLSKAVKCETELQKDIRITIAVSPGAIYPIDDAIIEHYKINEVSKKSLINGVNANVLIFEYIKPIKGKNGRACNGENIVVAQPKTIYENYQEDKETVYTKEDAKSIKYYSKIDGYVKDYNKTVSISKEIAMKNATFRNHGSIDTGEDKDISVNIKNKNSADDAVGSGVSINVKELHVDGTVGSHATVKANNLNIGEQTHRNAKLEAVENANVHLHRGNLKAKTAEIEILENGTIEADDVHVQKMLGGEIIGHRVIVEELTSNTIIIASESIEIHTISGEHNKLIINPNKIEAYHESISKLKVEIKQKNTKIREIRAIFDKKMLEHQAQLPRIKTFQKRYLAATKTGKTPNKSDIIRLKQYKSEKQKLDTELKIISIKEKDISDANQKLEKLYEAELHAKVINKDSYDGHTKVIFIDVKTSQEYEMSPNGIYETLFLVKDGDNKKISW